MKVSKGKMVAVQYRLTIGTHDGELIEETSAEAPLEFIFGHEDLLEAFEAALLDKQAGDKFSVLIEAENAYGEEEEGAVVEMDKSAFVVDGELDEDLLQEGEMIPMVDEDGNDLIGMVVEVSEETVTLDFNHPLAGLDLFFDGQVTDVREPSENDWKQLEEFNENEA